MRPRPIFRGSRGFSLLEAVVAMAIIAGVGMALFSWINSNIEALGRVQDANSRAAATANVLEFMSTVNPMMAPEGKADLGNYRMTWRAAAVTAAQDGTGYPSGVSLYQFALYDNLIAIERTDGTPWFNLTLRQVGYRKVRDVRLPFG